MKKVFLYIFILSASLSAKYIDLGISGNLYEIKEDNILIEMRKELKDLSKKINNEKLKTYIKEDIYKQSVGHSKLPFCLKDKKTVELNSFKLQEAIINPLGRVIKKKGDSITIKNPIPLDLIFVDGSNLIELKNQIDYFDEMSKTLSGSTVNTDYFVMNRSVIELNKKYQPRMFFPSRESYEKHFKINCYPTWIHLEGDKRYKFEVSIEKFKHRGKKE
jgi:hypothetical protein